MGFMVIELFNHIQYNREYVVRSNNSFPGTFCYETKMQKTFGNGKTNNVK